MTAKEVMEKRKAFRQGKTVDVELLAMEVCIDNALEKQIPKKPKITVRKYHVDNQDEPMIFNFTHCPYCFDNTILSLINKGTKRCPNCGQALDWSEDSHKN